VVFFTKILKENDPQERLKPYFEFFVTGIPLEMSSFKELMAYQAAFSLGIEVYQVSRNFPSHEVFNLTSQLLRSSRSVCANIAEAYRKRRYRQHFILKLTDALAENSETECWLDFAFQHGYLNPDQYQSLFEQNQQAGRLIHYMIKNPDKFISDLV
jgi:four helix bundle protein